ncbi:hypothetical protein H4R33_007094, partial [Dimargaris cristalligena]
MSKLVSGTKPKTTRSSGRSNDTRSSNKTRDHRRRTEEQSGTNPTAADKEATPGIQAEFNRLIINDVELNKHPTIVEKFHDVVHHKDSRLYAEIIVSYLKLRHGLRKYRASGVYDGSWKRQTAQDRLLFKVTISRDFIEGVQETFDAWQLLLHHQLAAGFRASALDICKYTYGVKKVAGIPIISPLSGSDDFIRDLRQKIIPNNPIFDSRAWRFIDSPSLHHDVLARYLPYLALVNIMADISGILFAFATLTDPALQLLLYRDWEFAPTWITGYPDDPLKSVIKLWRGLRYSPSPDFGYNDLFSNLASITMAHLALSGRLAHFQRFVVGIKAIEANHNQYGPRLDVEFRHGRLAVILSAMVHDAELVQMLPHEFLRGTRDQPRPTYLEHPNCVLADEMRELGLLNSLAFLQSILQCPQPQVEDDARPTAAKPANG